MSWCSFVILKRVNSLSSYSLIKTKQVLVEFWSRDRILKIQKHIIFPAVPIPSIAISSSYHQRINLIQKGFNLNAIRFLLKHFNNFPTFLQLYPFLSFRNKYILKNQHHRKKYFSNEIFHSDLKVIYIMFFKK